MTMPNSNHSSKHRSTSRKPVCYAIASGLETGIFFSWDDCKSLTQSVSRAQYKGFASVAQARDYLAQAGLLPRDAEDWIPTRGRPILYDCTTTDVAPAAKRAKTKDFETTALVLDDLQQEALNRALDGDNVFLTGVAGTGKSLVTKLLVQQAKALQRNVAVAAPTGVAAVNLDLGAQTLHSLAGVKVPQRARDFEMMFSKTTSKRWRSMEMLVLDEVGMLTADFLDWLDVYVRRVRHKPLEPFGGIQLVFVGDFAQLGPIPGSTTLQAPAYAPSQEGADCFLNIQETTAYAFQSVLWREANFHHIHLKTVYRQNDIEFVESLMDLREQRTRTDLVKQLVHDCSVPLEDRTGLTIPGGIRPTILYSTNRQVDKENSDNLIALQTAHKRFHAIDTVSVDPDIPGAFAERVKETLRRNKFFEQCQASKDLDLKVGAQVMLLKNLSGTTLVNGSRGVIEKFALVPVAKDSRGEECLIGPDDQEKFQGRRWQDLKWGTTLEFDKRAWKILEFVKMPFVKFMDQQSRVIVPAPFERNMYRQGTCRRMQVPLRLCWALTAHKSQGCSLDLVVADLKGSFTSGQAYVALSRAKSQIGLEIRNFSTSCVQTDPLVEGFYRALDKGTMASFLSEEAGIWWYPILDAPSWYDMFRNGSHSLARKNADQFRNWVTDYQPGPGYKGWKGYFRR